MTYIDVKKDRDKNTKKDFLRIVERIQGKRVFKTDDIKYVGYYKSENGSYKSINGEYYKKIEVIGNLEKFNKKVLEKNIKKLYEDDFNPIFRYLYENYKDKPAPELNICFFDIEVDFDPKLGFPQLEEPDKEINDLCYYGEIISITMYLSWIGETITLCRYPKTVSSIKEAEKILNSIPNVFVYESDRELIDDFLKCIEDADVLTGWNSEKYDIPYLIGRTNKILGKENLKRFCLYNSNEGWDDYPVRKEIQQYKKKFYIYNLTGRIHIDYLNLYRKHNQQQLQSYRLDYIGEKELGLGKVPYEGTLYDFYNNSYRKFIEYNRRDVEILVELEKKLRFIELANQIAHKNCVLLPTTMGSVALIEQAIINKAHEEKLIVDIKRNRVVKNYEGYEDEESDDEENLNQRVAGAYVIEPKKGIHNYIGGVDINSLYPSTIRTLNMGPETLIAQLKPTYTEKYLSERIKKEKISATEAAHDLFGTIEYQKVIARTDDKITVEFEKPEKFSIDMTAKEIYDMIFSEDSFLCISANGTIFSKNEKSIISKLLEKWYAERKSMQQLSKDYFKLLQTGEIDISQLLEEVGEENFLWFLNILIDEKSVQEV